MTSPDTQKPEAPNELIDERPETEKLKSSRDYFFDKWQATLEQLSAAQKEIGRLEQVAHVTDESSYRAKAKRWQQELEAERSKVVHLEQAAKDVSDLIELIRSERDQLKIQNAELASQLDVEQKLKRAMEALKQIGEYGAMPECAIADDGIKEIEAMK